MRKIIKVVGLSLCWASVVLAAAINLTPITYSFVENGVIPPADVPLAFLAVAGAAVTFAYVAVFILQPLVLATLEMLDHEQA